MYTSLITCFSYLSFHLQAYKQCHCKSGGSNMISGGGAGWEGTALLHHGSHVKLGCLQYVFSIVDYAPDQLHASSLSTTATSTSRISSMPLISASPFLHQQPQHPMSLLKSHLKSSGPTWPWYLTLHSDLGLSWCRWKHAEKKASTSVIQHSHFAGIKLNLRGH